ncbi:hypothetical protein BDV12DRAFT_208025 [Aspergillus spectabilis]
MALALIPDVTFHFGLRDVVLLLAAAPLVYILYQRLLSPLANVPGPFLGYISRWWLVYHSRRGDMNIVIPELHRKYGKIVRTGPNEVSVADIDAIKQIYGPGSKFCKSPWYSVWKGAQSVDLFAERDIAVHGALRRNVSRMYAMSSMTALEPWVDDALACFMAQIRARMNERLDLGLWVQLLAFDVIGEVSFSQRFGYLEAGKDDGTFGRIERALQSLCWVGQVPWVFWLDHYLAPFIGSQLDVKLRHGAIRNFAAEQVNARRQVSSDHQDILGQLFQVKKEKPNQVNDATITSIATANIFAGSDTTAISLRAIFYFLATNPRCLSKLRQEIHERGVDGRLKFPIRFSEANAMPYLQACIQEALRLHPAVGMSLPRVVPPGGLTIGQQFIPEGTIVGANPWVIHRDPSVWGADVDAYRPERWLEGNRGEMERCFLAFGGGARSCIGKNISLLEMTKVVPTLINEFDIQLEPGHQHLDQKCFWFVKQDGFIVRLRPRQKTVEEDP